MNPLTQAIFSGLIASSVYALLASGLIVAYRTSRVLNLAHGETFAVAGLSIALLYDAGLPLVSALVAGILLAGLYSVAIDQFLLKPRRNWPVPGLILITLAAAFLTRGVLFAIAGVNPLSFPRLFEGPPIWFAGGVMTWQGLALCICGFTASALVMVFLGWTRLGQQLRATAENAETAELMGINVDRMRVIAFLFAGLLGGLSAALLVPLISVDFQAGLSMTLRGFIAAALVGMSPRLAILGGLFLGLSESIVTLYFGALFQDPIVFLALIAIAIWQSRKIRYGGSKRA